jgi:hypothetical protein
LEAAFKGQRAYKKAFRHSDNKLLPKNLSSLSGLFIKDYSKKLYPEIHKKL